MLKLIVLVVALAHADPGVGRAQAVLNTIWSHLTGRYPSVPVKDIRPCRADFSCASVNGARYELIKPSPALRDLTDAEVLGVAPDGTRPMLLMRTREDDPTLLWAFYDLGLQRLKLVGFDKYRRDLPGEVDANVIAAAAARIANVTLLKYLTTQSSSVLLITREELSAGLSCTSTFAAQILTDLAEITAAIPPPPTMRTRIAEMEGMVGIISTSTAKHCQPKRLLMWKDALIDVHARVQAALADVPNAEFDRRP